MKAAHTNTRPHYLGPDNILHLVFEGQEVVPEVLRLQLHEASHLVQRHGGVELQVGPDGGQHLLLLHFLHEHLQLQPQWLLKHGTVENEQK